MTDLSGETLVYEGTFELFDRPIAGAPRDLDAASDVSEVLAPWPSSPGTPASGAPGSGVSTAGSGGRDSGRPPGSRSSQASGGGRGRRGASLPGTKDRAGKTSHSINASVWLATDFAISMQQFLPILETLAMEHEAMRRLKELMSSESLKSAIDRTQRAIEVSETGPAGNDQSRGHVFPVRASVPINIAVRALVHFEAFQLQPPGALPSDVFEVPTGYKHVSRVEAQKTPKRAKKRMLLANLTL